MPNTSLARASSSLSLTWASCLACRTISWASPTLLNSLSVTVRIVSTASSWDSPAYNNNTAHTNKTQVKFPKQHTQIHKLQIKTCEVPRFYSLFQHTILSCFSSHDQAETITFIREFFFLWKKIRKPDEILLIDNIGKSYMFPTYFWRHQSYSLIKHTMLTTYIEYESHYVLVHKKLVIYIHEWTYIGWPRPFLDVL